MRSFHAAGRIHRYRVWLFLFDLFVRVWLGTSETLRSLNAYFHSDWRIQRYAIWLSSYNVWCFRLCFYWGSCLLFRRQKNKNFIVNSEEIPWIKAFSTAHSNCDSGDLTFNKSTVSRLSRWKHMWWCQKARCGTWFHDVFIPILSYARTRSDLICKDDYIIMISYIRQFNTRFLHV